MKVVLDTNVLLVSISRRSRHYPIFKAFEEKKYELLVTTDILLEYEEIISEEMSYSIAHNTVMGIREAKNVINIQKYFFWDLITVDPDDNKFVDCAIAGGADFIVSDDNHFRILKKIDFPKVKVLTANKFLIILSEMEPVNS